MSIELKLCQLEALNKMHNGCILYGGVGSGKSITSLGYFYMQNGGEISSLNGGPYIPMNDEGLQDLYIITTARKRDTHEWEEELARYLMSTNPEVSIYKHKVVVDSWNNISKYEKVANAFFIFDEQRVVGSGAWVKSFLKIVKANQWILLSATPGDCWSDYIPVFIANGYYRNKTEFTQEHIVYKRFAKYPQIDRYLNTGRLIRLRNLVLVPINYVRPTEVNHIDIWADYDAVAYKAICANRWNYETDLPIKNASEFCLALRKLINSDPSRIAIVKDLLKKNERAIIFYNFDYELDILRAGLKPLESEEFEVAEYNGHMHQPIPHTKRWAYLVQYNAGAEGWNCIKTDTMIFYSENYSYKMMAQASGRIDRMNTPYENLYYYHIKSRAGIDASIAKALSTKKKFNETRYYSNLYPDKASREKQVL